MTLPPDAYAAVAERLRAAGCVFAEDEAVLLAEAARSPAELAAMVSRRVDGVPVEQVVGWAEFCGLRIAVEPGVFVPRRRSEVLARHAAGAAHPGADLLDMCCGTGAIGLAVASLVPGVRVHAVDLDPVAVGCARRNLAAVDGRAYAGDLFTPLPVGLLGQVDVVTVNAPYVPTAEIGFMPPEARLHEPLVALDGGADGLDVHRRVAQSVAGWLTPGGVVLAECSDSQAAALKDVYAQPGLEATVAADDEGTVLISATRRSGG